MASDPAIVSGVVSDPHGAPVPEARVWFNAGPVALPDIAALTDARGSFLLAAPAPGDYTITCAADGYAPQSLGVSARSGERVAIHFHLKP